ncbi:MAG: holo-ACP synthase [Alphaproteobacteria bacterium]|nr:holo-ACP synthase [Alphaproteobacteria bacterium]
MILGTGIDMVDITRIEKLLDEKFIARIFTKNEQATCDGRAQRAASYAKRFAAKEATAKALGTGIGADAFFSEIEVTNDERGAPAIILHGSALARVKYLTPAGYIAKIFLALSDEFPYAIAHVTIDATPA